MAAFLRPSQRRGLVTLTRGNGRRADRVRYGRLQPHEIHPLRLGIKLD